MIYHVLNGDALAENFDLKGEKIVCRECLIEGNLRGEDLDDFWQTRADFVKKGFGADDYFERVKAEFDKLENLRPDDEVNLWFGNEAFCQVNLWFVLWILSRSKTNIFRVFPEANGWNCQFTDLEECLESRQRLTEQEVQLGQQLWKLFVSGDLEAWDQKESRNFPELNQVCRALVEIDTRPKAILREITGTGETEFKKIFQQFQIKAGIYGLGDLQVKRLLAEI